VQQKTEKGQFAASKSADFPWLCRVEIAEATPFDTCCLTARIGGTATFTTRLVTRTDVVASELSAPWFAQSFFGP
jgi:hypothetical protein